MVSALKEGNVVATRDGWAMIAVRLCVMANTEQQRVTASTAAVFHLVLANVAWGMVETNVTCQRAKG
jgi:hypothetical protein